MKKRKEYIMYLYATLEEVKCDLFKHIELFYNRKRIHYVLVYMSPMEYGVINCN